MDELASDTWRTPGGRLLDLWFRPDTTDWNTLSAILTHSEYPIPRGEPGVFVDVGAHIGGWALGVAADNPLGRVFAIEALPENADLIRRNAESNGLDVVVLNRAAGTDPVVAYGTTDEEFQRQHRYIGGAIWQTGESRRTVTLPTMSLTSLLRLTGPIRLLKIDCEGCEWAFLDDPAIGEVQEITCEYHPRGGFGPSRVRELLGATHDVTLDDSQPFGPFRAMRR